MCVARDRWATERYSLRISAGDYDKPIFICRFPSPHRGLLYLKSPNPLRDHWKESLQWVNVKPITSHHRTTIPLCTLWNSSGKATSTSVMRSVSHIALSPTLKHPTISLPRSSIRSNWKHISSIGCEETLNEEPLSIMRAVLLCRIFHKRFQKLRFCEKGEGWGDAVANLLRLTARLTIAVIFSRMHKNTRYNVTIPKM